MPPVPVENGESSTSGAICSGSCTLQVVLGCVLPFLAVASWIPIILIKRHLASKFAIQRSLPKLQSVTPRALPIPRPPLTSVYVARVDYYVPTSQTACMRSVAEGSIDESNHRPDTKGIDSSLPCPELSPIKPSLPSLPSLSSMLNEFTAYADAIEPQFLTETKRSSTCLLDSVFSSMDVKALSLTELPAFLSEPRVSRLLVSSSLEDSKQSPPAEDSIMGKHEDKKGRLVAGTSSMICEANSVSCLLVEELAADSSDEEKGCDGSHFSALATDVLPADPDEIIEEISTLQLLPTRSTVSFIVDSMSTLASMLALRLAEFPPVPPLPPPSFASGYIVHRRSELSLGSAHSRSISVPASLNLLDMRPEDVLCQKTSSEPRFIGWPSFSNPGELWDEEDDVVFSLRLPHKPTELSKPMRHTWTAGVTHGRADKGDLWDEDDDRRFSCIVDRKELQALVLASMPTFNFEMTNGCIIGFSTARGSELQSPEKQVIEGVDTTQESADQTLCGSEPDLKLDDSGFAEDVSYADLDFASVKEQLFEHFPSQPSSSSSSSSSPASLGLAAFEDLAVDSASVYLSGSSRSSLMSFVSVLENTIRIVNTDHAFDDVEGLLEVVDMELESDCSYSSRTVSVTFPLVRDTCPL